MPKTPSKPQSLRSKVYNLWVKDLTKQWAYVQMAGAAVWASITGIAGYLNDPTVQGYLQTLEVPKYVFLGIAALGLITYIAAEKKTSA